MPRGAGAAGKLRSLEAARGVAATLVVLAHASTLLSGPRDFGVRPFGGVFACGAAGVDFFFVLSGFIIAHVHGGDVGRPAALGRYLWRRFSRVYPLFWAVMLGYGLILAASPTHDRYEREPAAILTSLLLLPSAGHEPILGVSWTLQHEVLFYALFATLIVSRRGGGFAMAAWGGLILLAPATGWLEAFPGNFLFGAYNAEFFLGIAAALALRHRRAAQATAAPCLAVPCLAVPCLAAPCLAVAVGAALLLATAAAQVLARGTAPPWLALRAGFATGAALMVYGLAAAEQAGRLPRVPDRLVALGAASYSLYLTHVIILMMLMQCVRRLRGPAWLPADIAFVALVAVTVVLAVAFSHVIEQPLIRLGRTAGRRRVLA